MIWHFEKNDFLQWCAESGVEVPPELILEKPQPRNMEQKIEWELARLNSKEPDLMNQLLRKLVCLDDTLEKINKQAMDLTDSLECTETHDGEEINQAGFVCVGLTNVFDQLQTIYSIVGQLAAELEVRS